MENGKCKIRFAVEVKLDLFAVGYGIQGRLWVHAGACRNKWLPGVTRAYQGIPALAGVAETANRSPGYAGRKTL